MRGIVSCWPAVHPGLVIKTLWTTPHWRGIDEFGIMKNRSSGSSMLRSTSKDATCSPEMDAVRSKRNRRGRNQSQDYLETWGHVGNGLTCTVRRFVIRPLLWNRIPSRSCDPRYLWVSINAATQKSDETPCQSGRFQVARRHLKCGPIGVIWGGGWVGQAELLKIWI